MCCRSYGGLIEFYHSPARVCRMTPHTGANVPEYACIVPFWWEELGNATYAQ